MDSSVTASFQLLRYLVSKYNAYIFLATAAGLLTAIIFLALPRDSRQLLHDGDKRAQKSGAVSDYTPKITVDIEGAVTKPGVYTVPATSRIQDVVIQAGGFKEETADKDYIARQLNLAAKIADGQKIYVLHKGEDVRLVPQANLGRATDSGKININTASADQLIALSGVGASTAEKIISKRPYATIEDLVSRKVINASTLTKIQSQITAD